MKILYLLAMFVMMTIMASAQTSGGEITRKQKEGNNREQSSSPNKNIRINRFINGISLGNSTKQDVIKLLNSNGREYEISEHEITGNFDKITMIYSNGYIHYYGVTWDALAYKLFKNTVYQVSFIKRGDNNNESSNVLDFVKLRDYFLDIYGNYHQSSPEGVFFSDKVTSLFVHGGDSQKRKALFLDYFDYKVFNLLLSKMK